MRVHTGIVWLFGAALLAGCGEDKATGTINVGPADTSPPPADTLVAPPDTDNPKDSAQPETSTPPDTSTPLDTAVEPPADTSLVEDTAVPDPDDTKVEPDAQVEPELEVRFIVLGDTGEGNDRQKRVAEQMRKKCAADGCDFALLTGDNIYNAGVESTMDAQWQQKFEQPYKDVDIPFYATLGNHDNGGFLTQWLGDTFGGAGAEFERGDYQVAYTQFSQKWRMPGRTYDFVAGPAHFFALDTNYMVWSYGNDDAEEATQWQVDTIPGRIAASRSKWRIAFGHHPYLSNGKHGDAGAYEGLEENITDLVAGISWLGDLTDVVTGRGVQESLDAIVCGRVDIYFAGHDHSRQWLAESDACPGTTLVVSGAGSKMTELGGDHPVLFQNNEKAGFFWVHLAGDRIEVEAIDEDGTLEWSHQGVR